MTVISPTVREVIGKASEVPPGTKKMFELKDRKILVINDDGEYYAINGLCSHYDASLENGIYSKGKIRCPLHGACFNVKTGDIEDFPGFDSLHSFEIKNIDGDLVIVTTESELKSNRRVKTTKFTKCKESSPVVIVGSGPAAAAFIESARQNGLCTPITLITSEKYPPYDRVALSKRPHESGEKLRLRDDKFYANIGVTFMLNTKVTGVNISRRTVTLSTGKEYSYSKLIVATGGLVRKLNVPGSDLKNIYYVREVDDANAIARESNRKHVVCIGSSFNGMEMASALVASAASVTVVGSTGEPLPAFGEGVGAAVQKRFEGKGIRIINSAKVVALHGNKSVGEVELGDGTRLPADVVVGGIGVMPSSDFLKSTDVKLDKQGFIYVDDDFKTNVEHVYAIGDVTSAPLPYWGIKNLNIQHFQMAQAHGELLGYSINGKPHPKVPVPFFWSSYFKEFGIRCAGCAEGHDDVFTRGDVHALNFARFYFKNERVVAVCNGGPNPVAISFLELFSRKVHVSKDDVIKNEKDDWQSLLDATVTHL